MVLKDVDFMQTAASGVGSWDVGISTPQFNVKSLVFSCLFVFGAATFSSAATPAQLPLFLEEHFARGSLRSSYSAC